MKTIRYSIGLFASALALSIVTNGLAHEAHKKDKETAGVQASSEKKEGISGRCVRHLG
jgi:hypothetical protein